MAHNMVFFFTAKNCQHLSQHQSWVTTPFWLYATAYSIYSQLVPILETVPPFAACGHTMPCWQEPTYHGPCTPTKQITRFFFV